MTQKIDILDSATLQDNTYTLFECNVETNPDLVAVIDTNKSLTYRDLAVKADGICSFLKSHGIQPEEPVGVLVQRRAEMLSVLLGIWKAGGAYVPFDTEEPVDRVSKKLELCGCKLLFTDQTYLDSFKNNTCSPKSDMRCFLVDQIKPNSLYNSNNVAPGGSRLAYLLFTSGSTGEPKAVEVEHGNVIALLQSARKLLQFGPSDRYLASSTIAFDASVPELFLPLVTGASLLLRDRRIMLDPERLAKDVVKHSVTVVQTGPSVWSVILAAVPDFPRIKILITHGEAIEPYFAKRLTKYGETVLNLYGPTETAVWATGQLLSPESCSSPSKISVPIGKPLAHVKAYVVNEQLQVVKPGVEGELLIGGPSVARGYKNQLLLTTGEKFVLLDGLRVYRTGDVVSQDKYGILHYFGRNDDQMQVKGLRVEPNEIEAAIQKDLRVEKTAATWFTTAVGNKAIVAAIVTKPGVTVTSRELHSSLIPLLPREITPSRFIFMSALPLTTSGKIDRSAIRLAASSLAQKKFQPTEQLQTLTPTELEIQKLWKNILGKNNISLEDHFFSIGGDSLSAISLMIETDKLFKISLPKNILFDASTLGEFASEVDRFLAGSSTALYDETIYISALVTEGRPPGMFFSLVDIGLSVNGEWTVPCPLYALNTWAIGEGIIRASSLELLALKYVKAIKQIQPSGPYCLSGYSLGGMIALEIAQQLQASGEIIELLFLLDPISLKRDLKNYYPRVTAKNILLFRYLPWLKNMLMNRLNYYLIDQNLRKPNFISRLYNMKFAKQYSAAFYIANKRIARSYRAKPYTGKTLFVVSDEGSSEGWHELLPTSTEFHKINCKHRDVFDKRIRESWMEWLSDCLSDLSERNQQ